MMCAIVLLCPYYMDDTDDDVGVAMTFDFDLMPNLC